MDRPIIFCGIDGANPLGFLAAVGVAQVINSCCSSIRLSWCVDKGAWRPSLWGFSGNGSELLQNLYRALSEASPYPFEIDKKLPFSAIAFSAALRGMAKETTPAKRRVADILAGFGSEIHIDDKDVFLDTSFRMVRSGDSAGQGLPAYALSIRNGLSVEALRRTLFQSWDYDDNEFSLRWDPLEDQRYALRWYNPSSPSNKKFGPRTMRGANALALEALALFPVQPQRTGINTTGFSLRGRRREFFSWPIWDVPISLDVIRSLLAYPDLQKEKPSRATLVKRGIVEVYRCERTAPNKYYKNFTPSWPA